MSARLERLHQAMAEGEAWDGPVQVQQRRIVFCARRCVESSPRRIVSAGQILWRDGARARIGPYPLVMVSPRNSSVRGSRTPGRSGSGGHDPAEFTAEVVADPEVPRNVVSYVLARRAALEQMRRRGAFDTDSCDASPNLLRAAKYHGEATGRPCPVCRRAELVEVLWVYGAQLGPLAGSARSRGQLREMAHEHGRFRVYVVEVCQTCAWNYLNTSYNLGDGRPRTVGRTRALVTDNSPGSESTP